MKSKLPETGGAGTMFWRPIRNSRESRRQSRSLAPQQYPHEQLSKLVPSRRSLKSEQFQQEV